MICIIVPNWNRTVAVPVSVIACVRVIANAVVAAVANVSVTAIVAVTANAAAYVYVIATAHAPANVYAYVFAAASVIVLASATVHANDLDPPETPAMASPARPVPAIDRVAAPHPAMVQNRHRRGRSSP